MAAKRILAPLSKVCRNSRASSLLVVTKGLESGARGARGSEALPACCQEGPQPLPHLEPQHAACHDVLLASSMWRVCA
jgi:hypothetical protein